MTLPLNNFDPPPRLVPGAIVAKKFQRRDQNVKKKLTNIKTDMDAGQPVISKAH